MNGSQNSALAQRLAAWARRHGTRRTGDLREAASGRINIDYARSQMHSPLDHLR